MSKTKPSLNISVMNIEDINQDVEKDVESIERREDDKNGLYMSTLNMEVE